MAHAEVNYCFPVIVEGNWGCKLSKNLKNKLHSYFQSPKRSGGGECKIYVNPGKREQITVYFATEEARDSVLSMKSHELSLPKKKKLKLMVSLPSVATAANNNEPLGERDQSQNPVADEEPLDPGEQSPIHHSSGVNLDYPEKTKEMPTREGFSVVVTTDASDEIEMDILEMYLESKKHSGGGPVNSCIKDGPQFIITFENEADAQEVLRRDHHQIKKIALRIRRHQQKLSLDQPETFSSLVVLENVQEATNEYMIILLIETVSGLSEEDKEFDVEMVPERNAAVITFIKPFDTDKFIKAFNQYHRVKQQNISAQSLQMTKSILVENIPPGTSKDYIVTYFESKKNGGGLVLDTSYVPEEKCAVITFQDGKAVTTILQQKHSLMDVPVCVYPYYESLGAALYGKEIKMPDQFSLSIDPYLCQFLQRKYWLLQEIRREIAGHYCEIRLPSQLCANPEIMVNPSRDLLKQKRSLVKTWKEDASTHLSQILSRLKIIKCEVNAELWEAIRNSLVKDDVLILPDTPRGIVVLVGAADSVDNAEQEMKVLIEKAVKKIEREKHTIQETIPVISCRYTILCNCELKEDICSEYPDLKISYDASKQHVALSGLPAEVSKVKSDILERISCMIQKSVAVHSNILYFLQHVDNERLSQVLFWTKKINTYYDLNDESIVLIGGTLQDIHRAEEEIKKDLTFQSIGLEDHKITEMKEWEELTQLVYKTYNCLGETLIIHELEDQIVIAGCFREVAIAHQKLSDFVDSNTYIQKSIKTKSAAVVMYVQQERRQNWINLDRQGVKIHFGIQTNHRVISLEGPRVNVLKGVELFHKILSTLHAINVIIDRPGAKAFFKEQEELYVTGAKQRFNCLIKIREDIEEDEEAGENGYGYGKKRQLCCEVKLRNGIVVMVQKADLTQCRTDVVISASNEAMQHTDGLAKALVKAAGPELQKECEDQVKKYGPLKTGCAMITGAWKLPCKQVIHAVGPVWNSAEKEKCIQLLKKSVKESLKLSDSFKHCSIAIPAISSGVFAFPLRLCTHSIVTAIKESFEDFPKNSCLKQIYLVDIREDAVQAFSEALNKVFVDMPSTSTSCSLSKAKHPAAESQDESMTVEVLQRKGTKEMSAFSDELNKLNVSQINSSVSKPASENFPQEPEAFLGKLSNPKYGAYKMHIGSVVLQVEEGDITQQKTDAIVNITNQTFNSNNGVSKAILKCAGPEVAIECAQLASQSHNNLICTQGGKLPCEYIIHLVHQNNIKEQVFQTLMECERRQLMSVAFPAIGTGNARCDPLVAASNMIDAIVGYANQTLIPLVREIKIIIFQSHLLDVFYASMQRKEVTASKGGDTSTSKSFCSKVAECFTFGKPAVDLKPALVLERVVEPAIIQICGDHQKNVEDAAAWIKNLILEYQNEIAVSDECISNFGESEFEKLRNLQTKLHIVITVDNRVFPPSLYIRGITKDVLCASTEIQKTIRLVREGREEKSKADLLSSLVEWRYEDNGQYKAFDSLTNMRLEAAAQDQRLHELTIQDKLYKVDPSKLCAVDAQGTSIALRRIAKVEGNLATAIPEEWDDMEETLRVKVVELKPEMKEYKKVQDMFSQTCKEFTIEKIERIQNPYYWQAYQIKKLEMDAKNDNINNERLLFHGTSSRSLPLINNTGFNRSYAGLNGANYGHGTYFAVNANYSAHNGFSVPDQDGRKYMYLARVLVGQYCAGSAGLVVPKPKSRTDPTDLFDSVTDNVTTPSMFVIFNDIQAYPEYLITFKK